MIHDAAPHDPDLRCGQPQNQNDCSHLPPTHSERTFHSPADACLVASGVHSNTSAAGKPMGMEPRSPRISLSKLPSLVTNTTGLRTSHTRATTTAPPLARTTTRSPRMSASLRPSFCVPPIALSEKVLTA